MVVRMDHCPHIKVNSFFSWPVELFRENLWSAGRDTSQSSSFILLNVVSGSKEDKYKKVTPCPLLVMCKVVFGDTCSCSSLMTCTETFATLVSSNKKVIGVTVSVLDWSYVWSGSSSHFFQDWPGCCTGAISATMMAFASLDIVTACSTFRHLSMMWFTLAVVQCKLTTSSPTPVRGGLLSAFTPLPKWWRFACAVPLP